MKKAIFGLLFLMLISTVMASELTTNSIVEKNRYGLTVTRDYMLTGETITWTVTGDYPIKDVGIYVDGNIEANCNKLTTTKYKCIYTVEPAYKSDGTVWNHGYHDVSLKATFQDYTIDETDPINLFFNPCGVVGSYSSFACPVDVSPNINFDPIVQGTTIFSNNVVVTADLEGGASAKLYVKEKLTYSSIAGRCPYSNYFPYNKVYFSVNNGGSWTVLSPSQWKQIGVDSANIKFKAIVPSKCTGQYDLSNSFLFASEVIK